MMIDNSLLMKIGSGTQKEVFLHPNDPTKVIKVMRGDRAHIDGGIVNQNIFRRYFSLGIYKQFYREILQYFRLCKNNYTKKNLYFQWKYLLVLFIRIKAWG